MSVSGMPSHVRRLIMPRATPVCTECGCSCSSCLNTHTMNSLDLHHEIEDLRAKLRDSQGRQAVADAERDTHRVYAETELEKLHDELGKLRDRYDRLLDAHKKLQRVNHNLEDKLLKVVGKYEGEKLALQQDVSSITSKLVESKVAICDLEEENERLRSDCNIAVKLLQCKPSQFVAHKLNTLPLDLQDRVKSQLSRQQLLALESTPEEVSEPRMIRVPMPTFPPTAMVYSVHDKAPHPPDPPSDPPNTVPTGVIAAALTQCESSRPRPRRIFVCFRCHQESALAHKDTQTPPLPAAPPANGYVAGGYRTSNHAPPGVHRPRLSSTETEI